MEWIYNQANGSLSHAGQLVGCGYSGMGAGKNNPASEQIPNVGPIPRGRYKIETPAFDSPTHGPYCLRLTPLDGTDTFGRSGFLIHGDSIVHPGMASEGCIIQLHDTRLQVGTAADNGDDVLTVV